MIKKTPNITKNLKVQLKVQRHWLNAKAQSFMLGVTQSQLLCRFSQQSNTRALIDQSEENVPCDCCVTSVSEVPSGGTCSTVWDGGGALLGHFSPRVGFLSNRAGSSTRCWRLWSMCALIMACAWWQKKHTWASAEKVQESQQDRHMPKIYGATLIIIGQLQILIMLTKNYIFSQREFLPVMS